MWPMGFCRAIGIARLRYGVVAVLAHSLCGCGALLSGFQPAHVAEKGKLQAEGGIDISFPTGTIRSVLDAAEEIEEAADTRELTDEEKITVFRAAGGIGINPPSIVPHVGLDWTPVEHWALGLKIATTGLRVGARRQFLHQEQSGLDLTAGLGIDRTFLAPPVSSILDDVEVSDYSRWNVDARVVAGRHGSWYRWWGGPRFVFSAVSQNMTLHVTKPEDMSFPAHVSGRVVYVGMSAGAAFGYESVFVGPEITVVRLMGNAEVDALDETTSVDIASFVIYPGFGVMGEF